MMHAFNSVPAAFAPLRHPAPFSLQDRVNRVNLGVTLRVTLRVTLHRKPVFRGGGAEPPLLMPLAIEALPA